MRASWSAKPKPFAPPGALHGFTLIEMIISIVLLGFLGAVGTSMLVETYDSSRRINALTADGDKSRYALERLARELRTMKWVSSSNCISDASITNPDTNLSFYQMNSSSTDNTSCTTESTSVTINYNSTNKTIELTKAGVTRNLVDNVSASGFSMKYLDMSRANTTTIANVRFIELSLTVSDSNNGQPITQRTRVALRNQG